jgi:hypothetical protein
MNRIRCFVLEPTGLDRVTLRRYRLLSSGAEGVCPLPIGYHNAHSPLEVVPTRTLEELEAAEPMPLPPHDDSRWPATCACGYSFRPEDEWQRFAEPLYRRADTGEAMTLSQAPAGAMWFAPWLDAFQQPQGEHCLMVKTPGGDWCLDSQCSPCGFPDDHQQKLHHCWLWHGTLPDITVSKEGGLTCLAGGGSVVLNGWHGFLRSGYLEEC